MSKKYLGDGVYADVERGMVKLTTENGLDVTNTIFLESGVIVALIVYFRALGLGPEVGFIATMGQDK